MARLSKAATNRQNAQKSTGPKTAKGKKTVSQNALRHGLSAKFAFTKNEFERINFLTTAFLKDQPGCDDQVTIAREAAEAQVTLERIQTLKHDIWRAVGIKSGKSIEETGNPFADSSIRNELLETYDEAPPHIQKKIRALYDRVNRAGTRDSNLVDDFAFKELLKLRRYEQNAANRRDKSLRKLAIECCV